MPLVVVANSPDKQAALDGLERWKAKHTAAAKLLAVDDVLVDTLRGRSSTWARVRVNLRNVPEAERPEQETPDPEISARKPSHWGSKIQPSPSGSALERFANIGKMGGWTGSFMARADDAPRCRARRGEEGILSYGSQVPTSHQ